MRYQLPRLYPITDRGVSKLSHAQQVERLTEGGASFIQLREKDLSPQEFYLEAERAVRAAQSRGAKIIINDRADIALALGADGVHLGQTDVPPQAARRLLGDDAIVGFSTHSVDQAIEAAKLSVDYIAIGPVYATSSKINPDPVVGLEGVRAVRAHIGATPLVGIGGITRDNARDVIEAGADCVAIIGALLSDADSIAARTREMLETLRKERDLKGEA